MTTCSAHHITGPDRDAHSRRSSGYIGLQVHSTTDVISYRDIRIQEL
ncbi:MULTISPECIES: hypothetical protein [unclassified Streptomyces]|nr:DUF1080 domain-containing protein [Streptomyces sp. NBC_01320]